MTESKHTPGPWTVTLTTNGRGTQYRINGATRNDPGGIAYVVATPHVSGWVAEREANVDRILACVNACEGIEDPASLRAERDELRAACAALRNIVCRKFCGIAGHVIDCEMAADALARGGR